MKNIIVLLASLVFIAGCGTTIKVTKLNTTSKIISERSTESVEIFTTSKPNVPYTEVSLISSRQASDMSNDDTPEMIQKMRNEAAKEGCDALIITMNNDTTTGATSGSKGYVYGGVETLKGFHGTCVVYK